MIIIGYPGIGKSTLAGKDRLYIDLESSLFKIDDERSNDWYETYCKVAEDLSKQGYIVFVSCHSVVREALRASQEVVAVVYPSIDLKDEWVAKLEQRYLYAYRDNTNRTYTRKDFMAYNRAKDHYYEDITELSSCDIPYHIRLSHMGYNLEASIIHLINRDILQTV